MIGNNNIKLGKAGQVVTCGRIRGDIKPGDKIYRTVSVLLNKGIEQISTKENIKREIECNIKIETEKPIKLRVKDVLTGIEVEKEGITPIKADNQGIQEERIKEQLSKLGNTVFKIKNIEIELEPKVIFSISGINELRRTVLQELENKIIAPNISKKNSRSPKIEKQNKETKPVEVSICLNNMKDAIDYTKIDGVQNVYIPLRLFIDPTLNEQILKMTEKFKVYILMPAISKGNYKKIKINEEIRKKIKGAVISNLSQVEEFKDIEKIANYTFNIANNYTIEELEKLGITKYITSPEFEEQTINNLESSIKKETIVYGRILLMTTEYCTIGTYHNCNAPCKNGEYKLKDRMGFEFPIITDRTNCNNLIYNSKINSIEWKKVNPDSIRIDILNESIDEINKIIKTHKEGKRLEGKDYTNGNLNKEI